MRMHRSRELVSHLKEHSSPVTGLALFDDDAHALSCSRDRSFLCWDLRQEKRISNHTQRMGGINDVTLSRSQTKVLTIGQVCIDNKTCFVGLLTEIEE